VSSVQFRTQFSSRQFSWVLGWLVFSIVFGTM